jgi:hypothetical protein
VRASRIAVRRRIRWRRQARKRRLANAEQAHFLRPSPPVDPMALVEGFNRAKAQRDAVCAELANQSKATPPSGPPTSAAVPAAAPW